MLLMPKTIRGYKKADIAVKYALSLATRVYFEQPCIIKTEPFVSYLWQEQCDKKLGNKIMPEIHEPYYNSSLGVLLQF